jgi:hypothetical protein
MTPGIRLFLAGSDRFMIHNRNGRSHPAMQLYIHPVT